MKKHLFAAILLLSVTNSANAATYEVVDANGKPVDGLEFLDDSTGESFQIKNGVVALPDSGINDYRLSSDKYTIKGIDNTTHTIILSN